jgi:hypothetical protein
MPFLSSPCRCLFSILVFIAGASASAQVAVQDSVAFRAPADPGLIYHAFLFPETALYNSVEYVPFPFLFTGSHPFYQTPVFKTGSLSFNNIVYYNVPLMYDVIQQLLIVGQSEGFIKIQLDGELVNWFTLSGQYFTKLGKDSTADGFPGPGFYAVLYSGKSVLLKKESKNILENVNVEGIERTAVGSNSYYLFKNNRYYHIKNKKSLLKVLTDRKKEIRQFMRRNKLDMKGDDFDLALSRTIPYYDVLNR